MTRRDWLLTASGMLAAAPSPKGPTAPVSIGRCRDYGAGLAPALRKVLDELGGLGALVRNKTVAVKINMTGGARTRLGYVPAEDAHFTHPALVGTLVRMLDEAGARRVRIVEGAFACADPLEEFMLDTGWDPAAMLAAGRNVEMDNTNIAGRYKTYQTLPVPGRGHLFPAFVFNKAYAESDLIISVAKLKEHSACGVTLSMKNLFGATPISIYGDFAGKDDPNEEPRGGRGNIMHDGQRQPAAIAPPEIDPSSPRDERYRMPRIVADLAATLPVRLAIIDGIRTMAGGEGPWVGHGAPIEPGLLIAGTNPACTDAVATALMGMDPMAERGAAPFEQCDSTLALAELHGVGTRDLSQIEIRGARLEDCVFAFRKYAPGPWARRIVTRAG